MGCCTASPSISGFDGDVRPSFTICCTLGNSAYLRADAPYRRQLILVRSGMRKDHRQFRERAHGFRCRPVNAVGGRETWVIGEAVDFHKTDRGSAIAARHFQSEG